MVVSQRAPDFPRRGKLKFPPKGGILAGLVLCGLVVGLLAGCKRPTQSPLVVRVTRLTVSEAEEGERLPVAELRAAAQRGLLRAGIEVVEGATEARAGDFQLRMQLQIEELP